MAERLNMDSTWTQHETPVILHFSLGLTAAGRDGCPPHDWLGLRLIYAINHFKLLIIYALATPLSAPTSSSHSRLVSDAHDVTKMKAVLEGRLRQSVLA
jgi:hypothetical protein